jgi:CDP-diacylglycerol---glycerol-3-phosphate 3-phosphatidyltransferase
VINVANVVTVTRTFLALITVSMLWLPGAGPRSWAFFLTIFVIYSDALDGYFARKLKQSSKFGAALDIAADRLVELTYWVSFACLNWIPVWVPLLFLVRGVFVDAIRAHHSEQGFTAFGEKTMMKSPLSKFLVASNFSRFSYAVAKALAFCLLIAVHIPGIEIPYLAVVTDYCVYFACAFCVIRGLPVLIESRSLFVQSS